MIAIQPIGFEDGRAANECGIGRWCMGPVIAVVLIMWSIFTVAGFFLAKARGRNPREGAILGLLLGPVGLIVEALLPDPYAAPISISWSDPRFDWIWQTIACAATCALMWWVVRLF
jgi:hypothetical protein